MSQAESGIIVVADDHPLFRDALRLAIGTLDRPRAVATAGSFDEVQALIDETPDPELVLLDLNMPGNNGFSGLLRLRGQHPAVPVVIVSATEDAATVRRALELGAAGFIAKSASAEAIRQSIDEVLHGGICVPAGHNGDAAESDDAGDLVERLQSLTPQQSRVLGMLGEGLLNKQIAYELGVSEATVKAHVSAVLMKLGVDSRTQAVIELGKLGPAGNGETTPPHA